MLVLKLTLIFMACGLASASVDHAAKLLKSDDAATSDPIKACDQLKGNFNDHHTFVNNLSMAFNLASLKTAFRTHVECLQRTFDEKLAEMQRFYETKSVAASSADNKRPIGQTGVLFYAIDQNGTVTDMKHEAFEFVRPTVAKEETPVVDTTTSLIQTDIETFKSDVQVLKAIMSKLREKFRKHVNLMKGLKLEKQDGLEEKDVTKKRLRRAAKTQEKPVAFFTKAKSAVPKLNIKKNKLVQIAGPKLNINKNKLVQIAGAKLNKNNNKLVQIAGPKLNINNKKLNKKAPQKKAQKLNKANQKKSNLVFFETPNKP